MIIRKIVFCLLGAFLCSPLFSKDIYHFDLKDYGLYWGMSEESFEKLSEKDKRLTAGFGYYIEFRDDNGDLYLNRMTYFENNQLCKISFALRSDYLKYYSETNPMSKTFLQEYYEKIEDLRQVYGREISTNIHCFSYPKRDNPDEMEEIIGMIAWWDYKDTKIILDITVDSDSYKININFESIEYLQKYNPSSEVLKKH